MTTELYLIRHGLAGEHGTYANDDERPLTDEGQRKTKQVGKRLKDLGLSFSLILTSPLVRAAQTAEILQKAGLGDRVEVSPHLAPGGELGQWLAWFANWRSASTASLALVGHEPGLSRWTETLVWGEARDHLVLKKAGVIGLLPPEGGEMVGNCQLFFLSPPRLLL